MCFTMQSFFTDVTLLIVSMFEKHINHRLFSCSMLRLRVLTMSHRRFIFTLWLPECQETLCSKQTPYLKFEWLQRGTNSQSVSSQTNTQSFSYSGLVFLLKKNDCAVLWVLICMVHLTLSFYHVTYAFKSESTLCSSWISRNTLLETGPISEV